MMPGTPRQPFRAFASVGLVACISLGSFSLDCRAETPLAYFLHSAGPASRPVQILDWALAALCVGVCIVIAALLYAAIHRKHRARISADSHLSQAHVADERGERLANRIVAIGTAISSVLLLAALVGMLRVLAAVADPPVAPALIVTVTAYDWWWKVTYETPDGTRFATANEIHMPASEPVRIDLQSADVVHAFWVPALAGKTQAIPGQVNHQWLDADSPGVWRGQCTQFCGPQHAHMAMEVVAQAPDDFARWLASQARPAAPAQEGGAAQRGEKLFVALCAGCHAIRGTQANGAQGPDLTHLASRRLIAAGTLANTPANRLDWVAHAQQLKPESLMPDIALTPAEASDLGAWLDTLQ
ncbi:cytochrome c oxidase subunit 2 [Paraburkholderia unamae]|uniref:Cytochrome c oxidase subunit 2 n=2 Tax=Paraburkholderia unamae TaxID=219649 RepID=A0ABX5K988_9BURK|nr:cytochrome c oxidase subunit II [Paraburkholderia unamae]PVX61390.1 cytochrome c oxidase subunit 2 [Paraburkholderia unamae]